MSGIVSSGEDWFNGPCGSSRVLERNVALRYRGFIFDLDGTIYLSDRLIPRADEVVAKVRRTGAKVSFLSNKAIQTSRDYAAKLNRLGIPVSESEVVSSIDALVMRLSEIAPGARLYVIGEPPLLGALRGAGFTLSSDERAIDYVVLSMDRTLHYGKLNFAMNAVRNGARLCATNPDRTCPFEGFELPDAGGIIAAVEAVTGAKVEFIAGKPSPLLIETALRRMGVDARETVMVGDRLDTDIVMGKNAGAATALVLTGVTNRQTLAASDIRPDYVLESVADILAWPSPRSRAAHTPA